MSKERQEKYRPLFVGDGYSLLCIKSKYPDVSPYRDFFTVEILAAKDKTLSLVEILCDASRVIEDWRCKRIPLILGENCLIKVVGNL